MPAKGGKSGKKILPEGGLSALVQKTDEEVQTGEEVTQVQETTPEAPAKSEPKTPLTERAPKETPAPPAPPAKSQEKPATKVMPTSKVEPVLQPEPNGNGSGIDWVPPKSDNDAETIARLIKEFTKMPMELERVEKAPKTFRIPKAQIEAMRYIDTYRGLLDDKRLFTDKVVTMIHKVIVDDLPVIHKKLGELAEIESRERK